MLTSFAILILGIIVLGFCVWAVMQIPMDPTFRNIARGLCVLLLVVWVIMWVLHLATGWSPHPGGTLL